MSKGKLKANIEWLSDPKIAVTVAVLVLIAIGLIWFFWDKIKDAIADAKAKRKDEERQRQNEQLYGSTTTGLDFDALASQMYKACKGLWTNNDSVEAVLRQIGSSADYAALQAAYRKLDLSFTLDARLAYEANNSKQLDKWRNILIANGVTNYTF